MDSRERISLLLDHKEADRAAIDYWATSEINAKLQQRYGFASQEDVLQHFGVDLRYIDGPKYIGPTPTTRPDGAVEDHWGVPRISKQVGSGDKINVYKEVVEYPLEKAESIDEIRDYPKWPRPDWFDYDCVGEQVAAARSTGAAVVFMGDRLNRCAQLKPAMYVRGVARILEDMVLNPDIAEYIFSRIAEFYLEYARRTLEAGAGGIDIFFTGDDFGQQNGTLISPESWRQSLRAGFRALIELGHRYGCKVAHHTCGSVLPIIPDMIDCGLDILNPLQPDVRGMDYARINRLFGDRLCFHGAISIQRTMPFGTPDQIRDEVRDRFESLGPGGGLIFCTAHNIQADTSLENVEALFNAYRELGRYR